MASEVVAACDPAFLTTTGDNPYCSPYLYTTLAANVIVLIWMTTVAMAHSGLPGSNWRLATVICGSVSCIMRICRYTGIVITSPSETSPMVAVSYILPIGALMVQTTFLLIHWRWTSVDVDFNNGFQPYSVRQARKQRLTIAPILAAVTFLVVEISVFAYSATPGLDLEQRRVLMDVINPAVVGLVIALQGWWLVHSGAFISKAIVAHTASLGPNCTLTPVRMNTLIHRMGLTCLISGPLVVAAALSAYYAGTPSPTFFIIKSVAFRFVELYIVTVVASIYKLPIKQLESLLLDMDSKHSPVKVDPAKGSSFGPPAPPKGPITTKRRLSITIANLAVPRRASRTSATSATSGVPAITEQPAARCASRASLGSSSLGIDSRRLSIRSQAAPPVLSTLAESGESGDVKSPQLPGAAARR